MVKTTVKKLLTSVGIFDALRYGPAYEIFLTVFRPEQVRGRASEVAFYRRILGTIPTGATIFDVGGNRGFKSEVFVQLVPKVICVEPDRSNVEILRKKFRGTPAVTVVDCAVGAAEGELMFNVIEAGSAYNTLSTKWVESLGQADGSSRPVLTLSDQYPVTVVTLDSLIAKYGTPHYIKIDVEGFELEVMRGLSRPVPFISFELNLPDFRGEGVEIAERLASIMPGVRFNYCSEAAADAFSSAQDLKSAAWLDVRAMCDLISTTSAPYLEVYARNA
ncbi:MAG: FkbM family methyltransferase [Gemmatimonadaceae bacterium]|nr:FkbM family methyltransferase [Gemmatimonadaceae bacterium]